MESSAAASLPGITRIFNTDSGKECLKRHNLNDRMRNAVHIAWATEGSMVPKEKMNNYYKMGTIL